MTTQEQQQIIQLIQKEVVPAIGCTEPIAVALAAAKAREVLGDIPEKILISLSTNVLKNAMGVGIPGTGMYGLPIAVALGVLIGKSEYRLEVLKETRPEAVEQAKAYVNGKHIRILHKKDAPDKLFIEVVCCKADDTVKVVISGSHTHFSHISKNGSVLMEESAETAEAPEQQENVRLNFRKVYDFATTVPLRDIRFIMKTVELNRNAAETALKGHYGHELGKTIQSLHRWDFFGRSLYARIISYTSAACDARMAGARIPVMSNSGSGNQGIVATLPVWVYAQRKKISRQKLIRALTLSHLCVIYIKQGFGRLSPLCGCVVAAIGSACGLTYLMGCSYEQITYSIKNMIANITGMLCDGAKPSCSLKVSTGVSTAIFSAIMAVEGKTVTSAEGIIDNDVDQCIRNIVSIGTQGMRETDCCILDIMTEK